MTAIVQSSIRNHLKEHVYPALISMVVALSFVVFLIFDRRAPFEYLSTAVSPPVAVAGQSIVVQRHVLWRRKCEGVAFTEIVSSDRIVTIYDRGTRYPFELGETWADRSIALPLAIRPGSATYRGVIKFASCGFTSRLVPLDIPYQEVTFEIR